MPNSGLIHEQTSGVYIISITPFSEDGSIDFKSVDSLVEFFLEKGVTGITILGMMGEANKLSANESRGFVQHVLKRVNGVVPVMAGVSDAGLANLVNLSRFSMDAGCAGVMVAPVIGLNTDQKLYDYYAQVIEYLGIENLVTNHDPDGEAQGDARQDAGAYVALLVVSGLLIADDEFR